MTPETDNARRSPFLALVALVAAPFQTFVPAKPNPRLAAFLSLLCPGLGLWYAGQSGIFTFYLSFVLVALTGAWDLLRRWQPGSYFRHRFLVWGLFAVVVVAGVWVLSIVDSYLRTRRTDPADSPSVSTGRRLLAGFLSLLVPGLGQVATRRFLIGVWHFLLVGALAILAWDTLPHHPAAYYARFTSDPFHWDYEYYRALGIAIARVAGVLWVAGALDAAFRAGQQDVLPFAVTRFLTARRMREAWPELLYALGFLAVEHYALDRWPKEPTYIINYLKYWLAYECLTAGGVLIGLTVFRRRALSSDDKGALGGLLFLTAVCGWLLARTDRISPGWLLFTFAVVMVPRLIHVAFEKPAAAEMLDKIRLAFLCLLGAVAALIPAFFFWKAINPWFYDHLVATHGLYTLGFFFYLFLGCAELRRASSPSPN